MYITLCDAERVANAGTSGRIIETADVIEKPGTEEMVRGRISVMTHPPVAVTCLDQFTSRLHINAE